MHTNLSISQSLTDIKGLDITDHQDCGAFRVFLPCANLKKAPIDMTKEDQEHEKQVHKNSLNIAKKKMETKGFENTIRMFLIDLNGTVCELKEDGTFQIIFTGKGTNPNGLFY